MRPTLRPKLARRAAAAGCALLLAGTTACGGNLAAQDPLAPIPTRFDPRDVEPVPLVQQWSVQPPEPREDERVPVPQVPGAVGEGIAYVARGTDLLAFALDDGHPLWSVTLGADAVAPLLAAGAGVAVGTTDAWMLIDTEGRLLARLDVPSPPRTAVRLGEGLVQVDGASVRRLRLFPAEEAGELWATDLEGAAAIAIGPGGELAVVTTTGGDAIAIELATGRILWTAPEPRVRALRPAVSDSHAIVVGEDSRLHALRWRDGKRSWTTKEIGVEVVAGPVLVEDVLWVGGMDSAIHGYRPGGSHLFRLPVSGRILVDLVSWGRWVMASPQYGPWYIVRGPLRSYGPADPGQPRTLQLRSEADLEVRPAVGAAGVLTTDANGVIRFFAPSDAEVRPDGP